METDSGRQSWVSSRSKCLAELEENRGLFHSVSVLLPFCTMKDKAAQASPGRLKICNLTHLDPLLWFNPWASLRNPFTTPKKLGLCQRLLQTGLNSWIRMCESFSTKYVSGENQGWLVLENGREVEALGPDQVVCLESSLAGSESEKTLPHFLGAPAS